MVRNVRKRSVPLTIGLVIFIMGLIGTIMSFFSYNIVIYGSELEPIVSYFLLGIGAVFLIIYFVAKIIRARSE